MKDHPDVVAFLRDLTVRVDGMDKSAEEQKTVTTPDEGQGRTGDELAAAAKDSTGKRDVAKPEGGDVAGNKPGSPRKDKGGAPADSETSGADEVHPELKEAARKAIDFDKLAEACTVAFDLLEADQAEKEAEKEAEAEFDEWLEKGTAFRAVYLEEFDKMAENLDAKRPGFKKQYELWGGGEALLQKLAMEMPTALVPEELGDEAAAYEDAMAADAEAEALAELGVTPEDVAEAEQTIEALKAQGVPEEAIAEALSEAIAEETGGMAGEDVPAEPGMDAVPAEPAAGDVPAEPAAGDVPAEPAAEDPEKEAEFRSAWSDLKASIRKQLDI